MEFPQLHARNGHRACLYINNVYQGNRITKAGRKVPHVLSSIFTIASKSMCSAGFTPCFPCRNMDSLVFDNRSLRELPIDKNTSNVPRTVRGAVFSLVEPTPVLNPALVAVSLPALALLGITDADVAKPEFVQYFSGVTVLPGARPAAHCYCGHQVFGLRVLLACHAPIFSHVRSSAASAASLVMALRCIWERL